MLSENSCNNDGNKNIVVVYAECTSEHIMQSINSHSRQPSVEKKSKGRKIVYNDTIKWQTGRLNDYAFSNSTHFNFPALYITIFSRCLKRKQRETHLLLTSRTLLITVHLHFARMTLTHERN